MKLTPNGDMRGHSGAGLAPARRNAAAEKLAVELDKTIPLDTVVQKSALLRFTQLSLWQRKDPSRCGRTTTGGEPDRTGGDGYRVLAVYLRGEAFLMLRDGNRAAAEFQKFIDHRGLVGNSPLGALARLGTGACLLRARRYRQSPQAEYQDFLALWKDADPDIPILKEAKAEYAKLQ